jgi:hypothetical protein
MKAGQLPVPEALKNQDGDAVIAKAEEHLNDAKGVKRRFPAMRILFVPFRGDAFRIRGIVRLFCGIVIIVVAVIRLQKPPIHALRELIDVPYGC